jgi:SAM-dependent methyltransferase
LDVGADQGGLTDRFAMGTSLLWKGVDPDISEVRTSAGGVELRRGLGHDLPYPTEEFDCVTFANVFEHVSPEWRQGTLRDIFRVLKPNGVLVGQLPNPHFPIESHSRLPFFGYVPYRLQPLYWKLTPTGWDFHAAHFFTVTIDDLRKIAEQSGFRTVLIRNFNYPVEAVPNSVRWAARLHARLGILPWAWQFVFVKAR